MTWTESLRDVERNLASAREQLAVALEQLAALREDAEEASLRALVTENSADVRDARHAAGHATRLENGVVALRAKIAELEETERQIVHAPLFDEG